MSALLTLCLLVFDSGVIAPITAQVSDHTVQYLANSVGIMASVGPNEFNELSAALNERAEELDRREAALRTIEARSFGTGMSPNYSTYILAVILFVLTSLIILNYILDWRRSRAIPL